ncbi:MAG: glycosyltransferase family 4 protein [Methanomassiliicoccales archaeon]|jgi:glycosyltransferase involved in cell wall biosynthesis|nr:glycosyltransferase family 4 protein [Methanomassiliicoccales archaeon]
MQPYRPQKKRIAFVPAVSLPITTNERVPKMFLALSMYYDVCPIAPSKFNRIVYDQGLNKFLRYFFFVIDEFLLFFATLRAFRSNRIDLVFAENSYFAMASAFAARIRGKPSVWDNHGNVKLYSEAMGKSRLFSTVNILMEKYLHRIVSKIFIVSKTDFDEYARLGFSMDKFEIIPICADTETMDRNATSKEKAREILGVPSDAIVVLFFGTLSYEPNMEAVNFIVEVLSKKVEKEFPSVVFYIAGGGAKLENLPENVKHLGFVPFDPDLCLWLQASDICIAPLWRGVGVLTKVVDMLSAGKPTILTQIATSGMPELEHEVNCLVGRDKISFLNEFLRLLADDALRDKIGTEGRRLIDKRYSWKVVGEQVHYIVDSLIAKSQ